MRVTVSLPEDLLREARDEAVDRGLPLSRYMAELLEEHLESRRCREAQERFRRRMAEGPLYNVGEITWTRDELHER